MGWLSTKFWQFHDIWIISIQSNHILFKSVACPFTEYLKIKWDSTLDNMSAKSNDKINNDLLCSPHPKDHCNTQ